MSVKESKKDENWSDAELKAAVEAYLWMLENERAGKPYNKSEINKALRQGILIQRTRGSIEYRMENISATLLELCHPWIQGYKPHGNVGRAVKNRIIRILDAVGYVSTEDYTSAVEPEVVSKRAHKLMRRKLVGTPEGSISPKRVDSKVVQYARDPLVKAWILQKADGKCELCRQPAPFLMDDDLPYLEVHHVVSLSAGGTDKIDNAVALCPNCHKSCHLSKDRMNIRELLYSDIKRLLRR